jgi:hypothetical protein
MDLATTGRHRGVASSEYAERLDKMNASVQAGKMG